MTEITRESARRLAVRYEAYAAAIIHTADSPERDSAIVTWGPLLAETQEKTGILMMSPAGIRAVVAGARERITRRNQAAVFSRAIIESSEARAAETRRVLDISASFWNDLTAREQAALHAEAADAWTMAP